MSTKHATLRYTAMRLGVFAACFAVMWVLVSLRVLPSSLGGMSNVLWVLLLAIVVSAPLSFVLLRKQRDAMSERIVAKVDETKARLESNRKQEDLA
ncbi:DUF4229 domain-containing protein [Streptomyces sp. NBC_00237]|uniref:DUF4229 domain-containing protein n=1 Tax=Streptomyces sp. NBC_00237 TaxID=2975687 RepID=UPI00224FB0F0|nr:DUF4229 domain-containing protein [Streptomyces sp. NBC_00237]MCX5204993.1 DUF4229 domain-containing protein [Streptomyces sp. NBC_00237]